MNFLMKKRNLIAVISLRGTVLCRVNFLMRAIAVIPLVGAIICILVMLAHAVIASTISESFNTILRWNSIALLIFTVGIWNFFRLPSPPDKSKSGLLSAAATLLPCGFLYYLYNRNDKELDFEQIFIFSVIFAAVSGGAYFLLARIIKTRRELLVYFTTFWLIFFLWTPLLAAMKYIAAPHPDYCLRVYLIVVAVVVMLLYERTKQRLNFLVPILAGAIIFLGAENFLPGAWREITAKQLAEHSFKKEDFVIDKNLPHPNVYWFHPDGMLSFENVEKYCGDKQEAFKSALGERGFVINEKARLNAGYTAVAIPALMCPHKYDATLAPVLEKFSAQTSNERTVSINREIPFKILNLWRQMNEMLWLFTSAGYEMNTVTYSGDYFYPIQNFYNPVRNSVLTFRPEIVSDGYGKYAKELSMNNLADILTSATVLPRINFIFGNLSFEPLGITGAYRIPAADRQLITDEYQTPWGDAAVEHSLVDVLRRGVTPHFALIHYLTPHAPWTWINGKAGSSAVADYLPMHRFAAKVLLEMIDLILTHDPDAIVVLQSDHGWHTPDSEIDMREHGFTKSQIVDTQTGVFSAVRLPEKWGGFADVPQPLDPRNISRILVNRYVGQNYPLLQNGADK